MRIGVVSDQTGISVRMLRHYDKTGLVSPSGRSLAGYREYSDEDVTRLFQVEGLRSLGLSLADTSRALKEPSFNPAVLVDQMVAHSRVRLTQEQELLALLTQVQETKPTAWSDVLHTVALVHRLSSPDPSTRQEIALSMSETSRASSIPILDAALTEADPNVAGALDWVVARNEDAALPALSAALRAPDARRRRRAVEMLVKINSPAAISTLAEAFQSHDPLVHSRATITRAAGGHIDTLPALTALIVEGRDDIEASDALVTLAHHGHADTITDVLTAALETSTPQSRQRLTATLGEIPGTPAERALRRLARDPDRGVAATATYLLRNRDCDTSA